MEYRYLVLPHAGYPDTAEDYVPCRTKADVAHQLVDYGWLENPAVTAYLIPPGRAAADYARELAASPDPYPDYVVSRGPRGGVRWERA